MRKIWAHRYGLSPKTSLNALTTNQSREGALLKVEFENGGVGYADLFPWPEFGDVPLDQHLESLKSNSPSTLAQRSLELAQRDANFRIQGKSIYSGLPAIRNHFLINDFTKFSDSNLQEIQKLGFSTLKIKAGRDLRAESEFMKHVIEKYNFKLRIDFNSQGNLLNFQKFSQSFGPQEKSAIEYVEDPLPWNLQEWREASKLLPLALDFEFDKVDWSEIGSSAPFSVLIWKPARQMAEEALSLMKTHKLKLSISNSLDHPVGMAHAAAWAMQIKAQFRNSILECSCISLGVYEDSEFSRALKDQGLFFEGVPGTGIGFDSLLEGLAWTSI